MLVADSFQRKYKQANINKSNVLFTKFCNLHLYNLPDRVKRYTQMQN